MKILVTGGTGLIGNSAIAHLQDQGHTVRSLSRHAGDNDDRKCEVWRASVTDPEALRGAADDCDVVLHIAGIAEESAPDVTFERVNVDGTRNMLVEAARAGGRRFLYVSSLGTDEGTSEYHASKRAAEALVRAYAGEWLIARPGGVFGPGAGHISNLVNFARTLPVVPLVDDGEQKFQPVWHEDVGAALAAACTSDLSGAVLDLAGPDVVTVNEFFDVVNELTDRHPTRVPLPSGLLGIASRIAERIGIDISLPPATLHMLLDGNFCKAGSRDGLAELGITATPLRSALQTLLNELPEQDLENGFGRAQHRVVRARVANPTLDASALYEHFVTHWQSFLAVETDVEPATADQMRADAVLTLALPLRGHVSVRVIECADKAITLAALDGHPLAGFVRFTFMDTDDGVIFEVNVYDRPATFVDTVGMALGGASAQKNAWRETAQRVADASGGNLVNDIESEVHDLDDRDVERVQSWFDSLRRRLENRDRTA